MKAPHILLVLLFSVLCSVKLNAEQSPYIFRHIGVTDGLPDNYVKSVFEIPDGRLGVRTTVLLSLYDGNQFTSFPYNSRSRYPIAYHHAVPEQYIDVHNRLWMKERGGLHVFDLTTERYIANVDSLLQDFGLTAKVSDMFIDSEQHYWFVTPQSSVYMYDEKKRKLELICARNEFIEYYGTLQNVESKGNCVWMIHEKGVIRCYDTELGRFIRQEDFLIGKMNPGDRAVIKMLDNGDYWLMWDWGIGYYSSQGKRWQEVFTTPRDNYTILTSICVDKEGNACVGGVSQGMYRIMRHNLSVAQIKDFPLHTGGTIHNDIHSLFFDSKSGALWLGLFSQGICYYHPSMDNFPLYNRTNTYGKWNNEDVCAFAEDEQGNILLGTLDGLHLYAPSTQRVTVPYKELDHQICWVLYKDSKQRIWVGTYQENLYCIDKGKVRLYSYPSGGYQQDPDFRNIRAIIEDKKGRMWISVYGGVGSLDVNTGKITLLVEKHPELKEYKTADALALDNSGKLIVGAYNGLYIYDQETDQVWIPERDEPSNKLFIHDSNKYNCILNDSRGLLWFGTQYALNIVTPDKQLYTLQEGDGLPNATIQGIQEDNNHDIWISTINSICKIKVDKKGADYVFHVVSFPTGTGSQQDDLFDFHSLKARDGKIYFGRTNGFNAFNPENVFYDKFVNHPVFTSLKLFNTSITPGTYYNGRVLLDKAVNYARSIELEHDENFITLDFSGVNFSNPSHTFFRYQLQGSDKEWIEVLSDNGQGRAVYNNLSPGDYVFRVSAAGNDKLWGPESSFSIVIHPPFWETLMARIIYFVLFCALLYGLVIYMNKRNHRKLVAMQHEEAQRQKEELNQMKFRFFTNISHELRTPLTLIITPLEILKRKIVDESVNRQLNTIYRNAQELLTLVNQLLDFRKLEMKGEKLLLMNGDLEEFVTSVYNSFCPVAVEKKLDFTCRIPHQSLYMYFDRDKVHKIINNLLSNAFKFTPENGKVTLSLSVEEKGGRQYAMISVSDTGVGIPEAELPYIFDRFYQVRNWEEEKPGSGIGLHLVREYAVLHGGKVTVESHPGQGSTFTVYLPVDLKPEVEQLETVESNPAESERTDETQQEAAFPSQENSDDRKRLLIVEDNKEFRTFLKEQLEEFYQVLEAGDGEEGEQCAIDKNPDLIISDIMMPKVDGFELCRRVKTNVQTSHIPVILLTARTADDIKINSYEVGADSYMSKPSNFDMLMVRIEKLIEQQEKRKQEFSKNIEVNPSLITITSVDEKLIQRALEYIEKNMDNTEYAVEELSRDLGMTRMNLYRKLQSITGNTPSDFIKSIRLKRAAQLLQGSRLTMAEVADRVGFSSASYFTKCFKEMFGVTPTQYAETYSGDEKQEYK